MTKKEASELYKIPVEILDQYESWGLCVTVKKVMGNWQYDDQDISRLSLIMTLHDIGFSNEEVETYMKLELCECDTSKEQMEMLNQRRKSTLEEIHFQERQLERMDYLRYKMRQQAKEKQG